MCDLVLTLFDIITVVLKAATKIYDRVKYHPKLIFYLVLLALFVLAFLVYCYG